jgi:hypothetical protein
MDDAKIFGHEKECVSAKTTGRERYQLNILRDLTSLYVSHSPPEHFQDRT